MQLCRKMAWSEETLYMVRGPWKQGVSGGRLRTHCLPVVHIYWLTSWNSAQHYHPCMSNVKRSCDRSAEAYPKKIKNDKKCEINTVKIYLLCFNLQILHDGFHRYCSQCVNIWLMHISCHRLNKTREHGTAEQLASIDLTSVDPKGC